MVNYLKIHYLKVILILIINIIIYGKSVNYEYVIDDKLFFVNNKDVDNGFSSLKKIFTSSYLSGVGEKSNIYRPVPLLSFIVTKEIFGNTPKTQHFTNILIWFLSLVLLLYFLRLFLKERANDWEIFFIVLFYSLLPLNVEPIANIKGRDDLLSLLFGLIGIICYLKSQEFNSKKINLFVLSLFFFFLSLLSKETGIIFIIVSGSYTLISSKLNKKIIELSLLLLPILIFLILRNLYTESDAVINYWDNTVLYFSGIKQLYFRLYLTSYYQYKIIFPFFLSWDYSFGYFDIKNYIIEAFLSIILFIGIIWFAIKKFIKKDLIFISLMWFYSGLLITSNLIFVIGSTFAERFYLIPAIGYCLTLFLLLKAYKNKLFFYLIIFPLLFMFFLSSNSRVNDWSSETKLLTSDNSKPRKSWRTELSSFKINENILTDNITNYNVIQEGIEKVERWKEKYNKIPIVYLKSGAFYESIKEYDKSIKDYSMALELDSNQVNAYMRLGGIYHANRVNNTLAIRYYLWGFKKTKDPMYYANIAIAYFDEKNFELFNKYYSEAIKLDPSNEGYKNHYLQLKELIK